MSYSTMEMILDRISVTPYDRPVAVFKKVGWKKEGGLGAHEEPKLLNCVFWDTAVTKKMFKQYPSLCVGIYSKSDELWLTRINLRKAEREL